MTLMQWTTPFRSYFIMTTRTTTTTTAAIVTTFRSVIPQYEIQSWKQKLAFKNLRNKTWYKSIKKQR